MRRIASWVVRNVPLGPATPHVLRFALGSPPMRRADVVPVSAIHLVITHTGEAEVSAEIDGEWVTVIRENHCCGGITSHIVEAAGIQR